MYRTRLSAMAFIAAGAALGYVAASIDLRVSRPASAASPSDGPAIRERAERLLFGRREQESVAGPAPARQRPRRGRRRSASRTSSSSWVTTSASGTSAPTTGA